MEPSTITPQRPALAARLTSLAARLRIEDWLLGAWIGLVAPLFGRVDATTGPFDPGRPLEGSLQLVGAAGALICLITGRSDAPADAGPGPLQRASIGPLVGGLLLVILVGATGVGLSGPLVDVAIIGSIVGLVAVRLRWPALPTSTRRILVTPFIFATGGIFWSVVDQVVGSGSAAAGTAGAPAGPTAGASLPEIALELGIFGVFAGIYYLMLIYAPRQVAEPEGDWLTWLVRFGLFLVSVIVGVAWLRPLGI
ncbi:MAG TPA: hypothetical protein VKR24_09260 [Candidatus Limnocylindrales bacterium]|nr:hypothetical protein [Candidatus Limnocylindrales bacterium]